MITPAIPLQEIRLFCTGCQFNAPFLLEDEYYTRVVDRCAHPGIDPEKKRLSGDEQGRVTISAPATPLFCPVNQAIRKAREKARLSATPPLKKRQRRVRRATL